MHIYTGRHPIVVKKKKKLQQVTLLKDLITEVFLTTCSDNLCGNIRNMIISLAIFTLTTDVLSKFLFSYLHQ